MDSTEELLDQLYARLYRAADQVSTARTAAAAYRAANWQDTENLTREAAALATEIGRRLRGGLPGQTY